jgi:putative sterol carrier protein
LRDGRTSHPLRVEPQPVVAVSVAGFPEYSAFKQLSAYLNHLYKKRLTAEIYIPDSGNISKSAKNPKMKTTLEAVIQGGKELVKNGAISEKTMADINTPARSFEKMAPIGNIYWKTCINEGVTPKEFDELGLIPRPDSIGTFLSIMRISFNPEKAKNFAGTYQYKFTGDVNGDCFIEIKNGIATYNQGSATNPDITVKTPFGIWMDILTKKSDGQMMLMEKKYEIEGDLTYLTEMRNIFS